MIKANQTKKESIVEKEIASILFEKGRARLNVTVTNEANKYPPAPAIINLSISILIP